MGIDFEIVDYNKQPLSASDIEDLIGTDDHIPFLNTRNALYRDQDMKSNPPSRKEAIKLMAQEPNLIRRPILKKGRKKVVGFDETSFRSLLGV